MIEEIKNRVKELPKTSLHLIVLISMLAIIWIASGVLIPGFLTYQHISLLLSMWAVLGIIAIGQTTVILGGGFDISVGATYSLIVVLGADLMHYTELWVPIFLCLGIGAAIGAINGICISYFKVNTDIMTIGMMIALSGITYIYCGGMPGGGAHPLLVSIGRGSIGGITYLTIIWFSLVILFEIILNKTVFGRKIRLIGSNPRACSLAGINVRFIKTLLFIICGILCALAGLFYLGWAVSPYLRFEAGVGLGVMLMIESFAAVVIGGTLFISGGRGGYFRTTLGVIFIGTLYSILRMAGLGYAYQLVFIGILIVTIVAVTTRFMR